ncbi:ATP-binding protein [Phytohabitans rumicis]|uniref:ATP-binding protein n=1 Tax=Phytohabitans rumicis TaxID=1076125 RepID=UPI0015634AF1|nr:ATP-binding protein [Phytohabitans rumicis]
MTALVGRDIELARLRDVLRATAGGTGGCLVITGPPGIGKTRLLAEMIRHGSAAGLAVASGQAIELDRVAPLKTVVSALREARPRPVDLSGLREHQGDRLWYVERIGEALEEYAAAGPLLVVVDDAHWTDEFSALALRVLVPRLSSSPVRWVLARRPAATPSPAHEAIDWLVREGAEQLSLAPLDEAAVGALCSNVLGAEADATVLALAAEGTATRSCWSSTSPRCRPPGRSWSPRASPRWWAPTCRPTSGRPPSSVCTACRRRPSGCCRPDPSSGARSRCTPRPSCGGCGRSSC